MEDKRMVLIQRLHERSKKGEVPWEQTTREGVFQAAFPGYAVRISREHDRDDDSYYYFLRVHNEQGALIEEIPQYGFLEQQAKNAAEEYLSSTFGIARRVAMGVDQALDTLIKQLEEDDLPF